MNCPTCSHAIFDALWGIYKCSKKTRSVSAEIDDSCNDYKEGKPRAALGNKIYESNLEG